VLQRRDVRPDGRRCPRRVGVATHRFRSSERSPALTRSA
jgi:hypothetical protein